MSKLHLATEKEFSYLAYLSVVSAIRKNSVVFWYKEKPESKWFDLIEKRKSIEFKVIDEATGITLDVDDDTGRLDMIYLDKYTKESIDQAFIDHKVFETEATGEFERKDIVVVRAYPPESEGNLNFITPEWVESSDSLFAALVKAVLLERVWKP